MIRKILHFDLDAFFCAVEEQRNPALRGKPFAVGGQPNERGVVASCSYPARRFGVRSAMPMAQAVRRCPGLLIVPANHSAYGAVSRKVMAHLHVLTPLLEQISIDEAFLDVSALLEPAEQIARRLQTEIRDGLGLPCSLGVASNKLVAKIANNVGKAQGKLNSGGAAPPNAIMVVPPGEEAAFLDPLPCDELWGVGPKTADRLRELGMHTIGDIARWPATDLARRFGKHGEALSQHARGIDQRAVETEHEAKSISQETTFSQDVRDKVALLQTLQELSQGVSRALKRQKLAGVTVKLKIRWSDFTTPTRQTTLAHPVDEGAQIYETALSLFERIWTPNQPVRLLGVGVSGFEQQARQLTLWEVADEMESEARKGEKEQRLEAALEQLRSRFGENIVFRAGDVSL